MIIIKESDFMLTALPELGVALRYPGIAMPETPSVEELRVRFETAQARLNAARIAYLNRTPLDGEQIDYEALKRVAQETIQANYALQMATYGFIRLKLSVAKLLRRGR